MHHKTPTGLPAGAVALVDDGVTEHIAGNGIEDIFFLSTKISAYIIGVVEGQFFRFFIIPPVSQITL